MQKTDNKQGSGDDHVRFKVLELKFEHKAFVGVL